ncbi:head maturation protease, ClpP-related [Fructilactobacillus sp. Tb1]|uniref:head maturation protease, ClpP-related n=1 Tax=Fructilactobacillus sp. Tb1 TaxID=3422304 RepID=UPI003D2BF528
MVQINLKGDVLDNFTASFLTKYLGMDTISPQQVSDALDKCKPDDTLDINLSSPGGDVTAGSEIYTMLRQSNTPININVIGMAASSASLIAMAGDKVNISPTGQMMIHKCSTSFSGNSDDLNVVLSSMNKTDQSIAQAYQLKTGMSQADVLKMMSDTTFMTAQDAVDNGFADNIMFSEDKNKPLMTASINTIPSHEAIEKMMAMMKEKDNKSKSNVNKKPTSSLKDEKLAIFMDTFK